VDEAEIDAENPGYQPKSMLKPDDLTLVKADETLLLKRMHTAMARRPRGFTIDDDAPYVNYGIGIPPKRLDDVDSQLNRLMNESPDSIRTKLVNNYRASLGMANSHRGPGVLAPFSAVGTPFSPDLGVLGALFSGGGGGGAKATTSAKTVAKKKVAKKQVAKKKAC
jgi:hypothetical protein